MASGSPGRPSPARAGPMRSLELEIPGRDHSLQDHVGRLRGAADLSVLHFSANPNLSIARQNGGTGDGSLLTGAFVFQPPHRG